MRGERALLRLGEYLLARACRQLPRRVRKERYREWAAELPVILHDPQVRPAARRAIRMVIYAVDTFRGTALTRARARRLPVVKAAAMSVFLFAELAFVTWSIWQITRAPGRPFNYLQLGWGLLLVAGLIGTLARSAGRVTTLVAIGSALAGVAANLWLAAQDPGDWENCLGAACLVVLLMVWRPLSRWARTRRAKRGTS
jgi:hypothetical protein